MTGLLTTCGSQFQDWTSAYRLFSHPRLPVEQIFSVVRRAVVAELPAQAPVCAVLDDSLLRRADAYQVLQLIVIAPLAYRLRKGSKLLYRDPAFLICTDENLDPRLLIEAYFQRWGIEVNFRNEKNCWAWARRKSAAPARSIPPPPSPWLPTPCCFSPPSAPSQARATPCCRVPSGFPLPPPPPSPRSRPSTSCAPKSGDEAWAS